MTFHLSSLFAPYIRLTQRKMMGDQYFWHDDLFYLSWIPQSIRQRGSESVTKAPQHFASALRDQKEILHAAWLLLDCLHQSILLSHVSSATKESWCYALASVHLTFKPNVTEQRIVQICLAAASLETLSATSCNVVEPEVGHEQGRYAQQRHESLFYFCACKRLDDVRPSKARAHMEMLHKSA